MDAWMQNVEQRLQNVDELQETVLGFREEIQSMGRSFCQEMQAMVREMRNIAHGPTYEKPMSELTHLRQTGTLVEFNVKFDTIAARLDLSEGYLVDVYVAALKEEIAVSVRLFNPRTLVEARRMARVQEISLLWRSKKKTVLPIKKEPQGRFPETQERVAMQEEAKELQEPSSQDSSFCSKQRFCSSSFSKSKAGCAEGSVGNSRKVYPISIPLPLGSNSSSRFVTSGCGMFPPPSRDSSLDFIAISVSSLSLSLQVERRQQGVQLLRNEQIERSHVGSYNTPSNPMLSIITTASSMLVVAILHELLSFFPLLLSLLRSRVQKISQNGDNAQTSKNKEQLVDCTQKFTWLQRSEVEKSELQLDSNFVKLQQYFRGYTGSCNTQWAYGLGWGSKEDSPVSLQWCFTIPLGIINNGLFQKRAWFLNFSPTRILVCEWFKGGLITMLFGRVCSLSRKKERSEVSNAAGMNTI